MKRGEVGYVQAVIDQKKYNLSFEQQDFVEKNADKMNLLELVQKTFGDDLLTERSAEYDDIRKYIAKVKRNISKVSLSPEQLDFIENNASSMKPFELAKNIFPDKDLKPLSAETQIISDYLKSVGIINSEEKEGSQYRPPKSATLLARKINKADPLIFIDPNDLTPLHKRYVEALGAYLQSIRFCKFMDIFEEQDLKEMFEEEFIKAVYDKPDLNSEELNMYINLCVEYINIHQVHKNKLILEERINSSLASENEKDKKLYMSWVELLQKREDDLHKSKKRAEDLQVKLSSTRAQRLKSMAEVNESLSKFVEEWKSYEGRKRALRIAEAQNKLVKDEVDKIESMEDYIANVFGVSKDEILRN